MHLTIASFPSSTQSINSLCTVDSGYYDRIRKRKTRGYLARRTRLAEGHKNFLSERKRKSRIQGRNADGRRRQTSLYTAGRGNAGQVVGKAARGLGTPYPIGRDAKLGGCNSVFSITLKTAVQSVVLQSLSELPNGG